MPPTVEECGKVAVLDRVKELVEEIVGSATDEGKSKAMAKERRLEDAKRQKARLLEYLRLWWTNLEDGVPDLETEMDPQPIQRVMKRKRKAGNQKN